MRLYGIQLIVACATALEKTRFVRVRKTASDPEPHGFNPTRFILRLMFGPSLFKLPSFGLHPLFAGIKARLLVALLSFWMVLSAASAWAMTAAEADMIDSAAQRGSASAQVLLGVIYLNGMAEHAKDEARAALWFEKAAQQGNDYAQKMLADLYEEGRGLPKNLLLAADWREKAAKRGNVQAQFLLGKMYLAGAGVGQDKARAAYWLNRAAIEGGNLDAQNLLAKMQSGGNASFKNPALDADPLAQSAERSYADAAQLVQFLETLGYRIKESLYKHPPDLEKLARDGDADAQYQLAIRYETGTHNLPQNWNLALYWFKQSAQRGHILAMQNLAHLYQDGVGGIAVDQKTARYWREKAASQVRSTAQGSLNPASSSSFLSDALSNDLISFSLSSLMLVAYQGFLWRKTRADPTYTVQAVNTFARTVWVETIMKDSDKGVLAIQTLRNSTMAATFLASTAVLLIIGALTLSGQGDKLDSTWHALNSLGAKHAELRIGKLLILLVDLFIAFFSFAMAVRIYNHVGYMINVPLTLKHHAISPIHVATHLNSGGKFYSIGMRAYYYAVPLVFWLFGPHFMLVATVVLIAFLYHLDRAPQVLADDYRRA